jgi:DNA-binding transcriptional ArsR family regulator
MDAIFKALNDPARRAILDALRAKDGQTLTELEARFEITRFGVMKHLKVLEDAHLVITHRAGRFKHHYINAVPLQEVTDRWIEPLLARPAVRDLIALKRQLEAPMPKPDFVMSTFIRCTPDALWDALTDPGQMARYHFLATHVCRDGATYEYRIGEHPMLVTRTLEIVPKSRIVATFEPKWEGGGAPSRTVFLISAEGDHCSLTLEHYELTFPVVPGEGIHDGWARWAAGLKTWLETGEAVRFCEERAGADA